MDLLKKTDEEIIEIANPIWDNLVKTSNQKNYDPLKKRKILVKYTQHHFAFYLSKYGFFYSIHS